MKCFLALAIFFASLFGFAGCGEKMMNSQQVPAASLQQLAINADSDKLAVMGRTHINADGSRTFGFPGVSVSLNVVGKRLTATVFSSGNSWLDVIVDGGEPVAIKLANEPQQVELFNFPESGSHSVNIVHRTETWQGVVTLQGFELEGEQFLPAPSLPARRMLVLGDSVTCGEGVSRTAGEEKNPRWWDARHSYGMLTANALNAQVQLVCWGGRGLVRSWNGKTDEQNLPDFYQYAVAGSDSTLRWQVQAYQPDVIVSAIGTNDFSPGIPNEQEYVSAYVAFVKILLADYPQANIALTEGSILNGEKKAALVAYLHKTIAELNSSRVFYVASTYYPGDDSDAHPTGEQHAAMANDLAPQLQAIMAW